MVHSRLLVLAVSLVAAWASGAALAQDRPSRRPSPPGARVYFQSPVEGAHVGTSFMVRAGLHGMGVAPSGEPAANTGHHHLLIDAEMGNLAEPLPINNQIVHFSNGETEIKVTLPRGWHKLQLVLADAGHLNFDPPVVSKPIRIYVGSAEQPAPHVLSKGHGRRRTGAAREPGGVAPLAPALPGSGPIGVGETGGPPGL